LIRPTKHKKQREIRTKKTKIEGAGEETQRAKEENTRNQREGQSERNKNINRKEGRSIAQRMHHHHRLNLQLHQVSLSFSPNVILITLSL